MGFYGRGKNKIQNPYTLMDMYDSYYEDNKHTKLYNIEYSVYRKLNEDFFKGMMDHIIEKAGTFKLPYRLGKVYVLKEKIDLDKLFVQAVDWQKTVKYGKVIYHLNEHTNGYKYSYQWDKKRSAIPNLYFYRLTFTRTNKRRLARLIKTGDYDYFEKA